MPDFILSGTWAEPIWKHDQKAESLQTNDIEIRLY